MRFVGLLSDLHLHLFWRLQQREIRGVQTFERRRMKWPTNRL